jgi:formate hydrogenlyase subunit 6/NADH:ubiquinone oxidoreductase subunit I
MGIWNILTRNFSKKSRTLAPKMAVPHPELFRGLVLHDANRCTGCATCTYVCSPGAITISGSSADAVDWDYFAGQCTFCGRCVEFCPTGALTFSHQSAPVTTHTADLRTHHHVEGSACPQCGKRFIPLPGPALIKLYGDPLPAEIAETRYLCPDCRNKAATRRVKEGMYGQLARRAGDHIDRSANPHH